MSDFTNDDVFNAFKAKAKADKEAQANRASNSASGSTRTYTDIKWVGLEQNVPHIMRIVSNPPETMTPGFKAKPTDSRELFFSKIVDDNGKKMELRLPLREDIASKSHIMWRIIDRVKEVSWVPSTENPAKNEKVYVNRSHDWFDRVVHGGYDVKDPNYMWTKGWSGQQAVVMNVIDREDNWCAENKHTKILTKKIDVVNNADGTIEFPFRGGMLSYGFLSKLAEITGKYGPWQKYDVAIWRTGETTNPVEAKPATVFKNAGLLEEIGGEAKAGFISDNNSLTPEELAYEQYNLEQLFPVTSYGKILTHLGNTIKGIDASLNTTFYEELQNLAAKEKAELEAKATTQATVAPTETVAASNTATVAPVTESVAPATRTVSRTVSAPTAGLTADKIALLKGYNKLTQSEKDMIVDVVVNPDGSLKEVVYKEGCGDVAECPVDQGGCKQLVPLVITTCCPVCGMDY